MEWWSRREAVGIHVKDWSRTYSCVEEMSEAGVSDPSDLREEGFPHGEVFFCFPAPHRTSHRTLYICKLFLGVGKQKTLLFFLLHV